MAKVNRLIEAGKDVNEKDNVSDGYNQSLLPTYSAGSLYIFNKILSIPLPLNLVPPSSMCLP